MWTGVGGGVVKPDLGTFWLTRISKRTGWLQNMDADMFYCCKFSFLQSFGSLILFEAWQNLR